MTELERRNILLGLIDEDGQHVGVDRPLYDDVLIGKSLRILKNLKGLLEYYSTGCGSRNYKTINIVYRIEAHKDMFVRNYQTSGKVSIWLPEDFLNMFQTTKALEFAGIDSKGAVPIQVARHTNSDRFHGIKVDYFMNTLDDVTKCDTVLRYINSKIKVLQKQYDYWHDEIIEP